MVNLAHLRFSDDVFPVVEALQRVRPLQAMDAREYYDEAPEGWYVVTMNVGDTREMLEVVAQVSQSLDDKGMDMLAAAMRKDGDGCLVVFFNLRGFAQSVH